MQHNCRHGEGVLTPHNIQNGSMDAYKVLSPTPAPELSKTAEVLIHPRIADLPN